MDKKSILQIQMSSHAQQSFEFSIFFFFKLEDLKFNHPTSEDSNKVAPCLVKYINI